MASRRDRQIIQARELDEASTALIKVGINVVKRNPIKTSLYLLGVLLCLFVSGFSVTEKQRVEYAQIYETIDNEAIFRSQMELRDSYDRYFYSKGWFFSCDHNCQRNYQSYLASKAEYDALKREEAKITAVAKSKLGLFSEYGVEETRDLFWHRFAQGKNFAKRQSMYDVIFYGIGAMSRDESFLKYVLRVATSALVNFTIGMALSVVTFMFNLWSIISSYQPSYAEGLLFFGFASLAAISFALSWLIGLYCVAAGTAYVGLVVAKNAMLLENDQRRHRIH
mmetsp:Transcript_43046/g.31429  ORF Transcript_43046/g.31429 Transcript_43046/m.31429 type:complete len:281 (+) Transcript_43046:66-908(+)